MYFVFNEASQINVNFERLGVRVHFEGGRLVKVKLLEEVE